MYYLTVFPMLFLQGIVGMLIMLVTAYCPGKPHYQTISTLVTNSCHVFCHPQESECCVCFDRVFWLCVVCMCVWQNLLVLNQKWLVSPSERSPQNPGTYTWFESSLQALYNCLVQNGWQCRNSQEMMVRRFVLFFHVTCTECSLECMMFNGTSSGSTTLLTQYCNVNITIKHVIACDWFNIMKVLVEKALLIKKSIPSVI